jgi:predicted nucleotidyltransferase
LIRAGAGRLRKLAGGAYMLAARAAAAYLRQGRPQAAVYLTRGAAAGDLVPGISDLDLALVLDDDPARRLGEHLRAKRRWQKLVGALPPAVSVAATIAAYEQWELEDTSSASILTYGLDAAGSSPAAAPGAMFGLSPANDEAELGARPGVKGPMSDWRLLAGPERRPSRPAPDRQQQLIGGWLELQFWWRNAFHVCTRPERPSAAYACVKMATEPLRILLALRGEDPPAKRASVLSKAAATFPEHRSLCADAEHLLRMLSCSPQAPLGRFLPELARLSEQIAALIAEELSVHGSIEVELLTTTARGGPDAALPLADWRAVVVPSRPDEVLLPVEIELAEPTSISEVARATSADPQPVARHGSLMIMPIADPWPLGFLRSLQAPFSDPVSSAVLDGNGFAAFPAVAGWSAGDWAARAVAEHAAWLRRGPDGALQAATPREWIDGAGDTITATGRALAKLLTATRAALFLESIESNHPCLALTVEAAVEELTRSGADENGIGAEAIGAYAGARNGAGSPPVELVYRFDALVRSLPAYGALGETS